VVGVLVLAGRSCQEELLGPAFLLKRHEGARTTVERKETTRCKALKDACGDSSALGVDYSRPGSDVKATCRKPPASQAPHRSAATGQRGRVAWPAFYCYQEEICEPMAGL